MTLVVRGSPIFLRPALGFEDPSPSSQGKALGSIVGLFNPAI